MDVKDCAPCCASRACGDAVCAGCRPTSRSKPHNTSRVAFKYPHAPRDNKGKEWPSAIRGAEPLRRPQAACASPRRRLRAPREWGFAPFLPLTIPGVFAITCNHLQALANNCNHLQSLASTYEHLPTIASICNLVSLYQKNIDCKDCVLKQSVAKVQTR